MCHQEREEERTCSQVPGPARYQIKPWWHGGLLASAWFCICVSGEHPACHSLPPRQGLQPKRHFPFSQILYVRNKMKTAPQITAPLIIHQRILLNKHNRPLPSPKGQSQLEIQIPLWKIGLQPRVLSIALAIHREEIALCLEADSRCTHASQNIYVHMCMYTQRQAVAIHTCLGTEYTS